MNQKRIAYSRKPDVRRNRRNLPTFHSGFRRSRVQRGATRLADSAIAVAVTHPTVCVGFSGKEDIACSKRINDFFRIDNFFDDSIRKMVKILPGWPVVVCCSSRVPFQNAKIR
jgi:hypothetical protein